MICKFLKATTKRSMKPGFLDNESILLIVKSKNKAFINEESKEAEKTYLTKANKRKGHGVPKAAGENAEFSLSFPFIWLRRLCLMASYYLNIGLVELTERIFICKRKFHLSTPRPTHTL